MRWPPRFVKAPEMQSLNLPKDFLARTARTAIGLGISNNQANALISSVVANAGGDVDQITLSVASTHRIQHKIITENLGQALVFNFSERRVQPRQGKSQDAAKDPFLEGKGGAPILGFLYQRRIVDHL